MVLNELAMFEGEQLVIGGGRDGSLLLRHCWIGNLCRREKGDSTAMISGCSFPEIDWVREPASHPLPCGVKNAGIISDNSRHQSNLPSHLAPSTARTGAYAGSLKRVRAQYQELAKFHFRFFVGFYLLFAIGWLSGWILGAPDKGVRKAMAFSTPQRNSGIALVIASANFPNTAAVSVAIIFAVLLALTGLVVQFAMRKL